MFFLIKQSLRLALLLQFIYSCNPNSPRIITEMEFNVDSSIVDKPESDSSLNIKYAVPGKWQTIEGTDEAIKQVHAGNIRLSKLLKNPSGTVVFSLTDVRQVPDSIFRNMDVNYKTVLNPSGNWSTVDRAEFIAAEYQVKQYVMTKKGQTFFKILFGDRMRPSFQIDYSVIVDSAYPSNTKTLESIIGSLHREH